MTWIKKILISTGFSILVFFSLSFMTILIQINSPIHRYERFEHKIGFPFTYYHEFMVDCPIPNSSWNIKNLIIDCVITWIIITGLYMIIKRNK